MRVTSAKSFATHPKKSPRLSCNLNTLSHLSVVEELESIAGTSGGNKATKKKAFVLICR